VKPSNHPFMNTALVTTNRIFWNWNWCCLIWNVKTPTNRLQITDFFSKQQFACRY